MQKCSKNSELNENSKNRNENAAKIQNATKIQKIVTKTQGEGGGNENESSLKIHWHFFATLCLLIGLLVLSYTIPQEKIYENSKASAEYMAENETDFYMPLLSEDLFELHDYADAIWLSIAYNADTEHPLKSALEGKYYNGFGDWLYNLYFYRDTVNYDYEANTDYYRYWQGTVMFLRPLLTKFTYMDIRYINVLLLTGLNEECFYCPDFQYYMDANQATKWTDDTINCLNHECMNDTNWGGTATNALGGIVSDNVKIYIVPGVNFSRLKASVEGAGGSISTDPFYRADASESVTCQITASEGYKIKKLEQYNAGATSVSQTYTYNTKTATQFIDCTAFQAHKLINTAKLIAYLKRLRQRSQIRTIKHHIPTERPFRLLIKPILRSRGETVSMLPSSRPLHGIRVIM